MKLVSIMFMKSIKQKLLSSPLAIKPAINSPRAIGEVEIDENEGTTPSLFVGY